jgi:LysM repeat protein
MSFGIRLALGALAVGLGLAAGGCSPSAQGRLGEEKEPHFVLGKSRVNAMDYQGAVEAFEQSLEVNPRSAAAHFELGWLFDEKESDPAAAIFHYQEYLKLNPQADNADIIKQRLYRCKQQLAADVLPMPSAPATQQQLEKLIQQNRQLQDEVDKWRAYYAGQLAAARTNAPVPGPNNPVPAAQNGSAQTGGAAAGDSPNTTPTPAAQSRTHTIAAGETSAGIARKVGIKLSALQAANPGVNLSKIRAGQVLNLPPP